MNAAARQQAGGVVFDCDGVLADTTPCWEHAFHGVARGLGMALGPAQLAALRGTALTTAARRLARWSGRALHHDDVHGMLRQQLVRAIDTAELTLADEVLDLLNELRDVVCLGVASNAPRAVLLHILAHLEITEYFAAAISAEDVARPKPAPDPYLAACRALRVEPWVSFAVEDSRIGVRSALAAGLTVIEVAESRSLSPGRRRSGASTLRVRSLADPRIRPLLLGLSAAPASPPPDLAEPADAGATTPSAR